MKGKQENMKKESYVVPYPVPWLPLPSSGEIDEAPPRSPAQSFIKKLYAFLTINQALKKDDEASQAKALQLALDNNFVTKLTSLVVVKENKVKETVLPTPVNLLRPNYAHAQAGGFGGFQAQAQAQAGSFGGFGGAHVNAFQSNAVYIRSTTTTTTPINYEDCKLSLFSKTYKRGVSITLTDTKENLGDFNDLAVSTEVEGQCCWRVSGKPGQLQEDTMVLRPAVPYNSVTSLGNLLRNIFSAERIDC